MLQNPVYPEKADWMASCRVFDHLLARAGIDPQSPQPHQIAVLPYLIFGSSTTPTTRLTLYGRSRVSGKRRSYHVA